MNRLESTGARMIRTMRPLLIGGLLLAAPGCSDDILDLRPTDQYSDADVWADLALVQAYVDQLYSSVNAGFSHINCVGLSDEAFNTHDYCATSRVNTGALSPSLPAWNPWNGNYTTIRRTNIFLERIDDVPGDEARKARLAGEIRFLRANKYVELAKAYGGVPLLTRPFLLEDDFETPRMEFHDVVQWIVGELDEAISVLPVANSGAELGRADGRAAMALKADILLYAASPLHNESGDQALWQAASDAAKAVIDLGIHSLWTGDYKELFLKTWKPEVIWGRVYHREYEDHNNFERNVATNGYSGWSAHTPIQQHVDAYEMANGLPITDPASGYDPGNPYDGRDPRLYANIVFDDAMFWGRRTEFWDGGRDSNKGIQPWNASLTGYVYRKWFDETRILGAPRASEGSPNRVWAIYRLAEIYLNYAEAQYHLGNHGVASQYVNMVRTRPGVELPPTTASGPALLEAIQHERRIELAFEFKRFWDLLRWREAENVLSRPASGVYITRDAATGVKTYDYDCAANDQCLHQQRAFHPHMYLMPIPNAEMLRTQSLVQNPGYN